MLFLARTLKFLRHFELEYCHDEAAMILFPTVFFSLGTADVARMNHFVDILVNSLAL